MNRFLWSLVTLLPLIFWNKLSKFLFGPADPSEAPASQSVVTRRVAQFAASHGLSETAVSAIVFLMLAYSTIFGLLTHLMLADKGFGSKLNGLVGMIGGAGVAALWFLSPKGAFSYSSVLITVIVGSTVHLAAACVVKAIIFAHVDDYFSGASTPARSTASARLAAVASRRR